MATKQDKYIQDLIESIKNKNKPDIESVAKYDPAKQAAGLQTRLEGSGVKPDKLDKRNFVEKALNLTPNQNALFDVFEIINRPQQMLFQGIKAAQEDEDIFKAVRKGFGGVGDDVRFKEILQNAGMEDSGKDFGADDILGFAGDVLVDPIDLALVVATPFTGGASGAALATKRSLQAADNTIDTLKGAKQTLELAQAAGKLDDVAELARVNKQLVKTIESRKLWQNLDDAANNLLKIQEVAKKTGDATGYADAFDAYKTAVRPLKKRMTPLEFTFKQAKGGFNKAIDLTDNGISGVLSKLDAHTLDNQKKVIEGALSPEIANKLRKEFGMKPTSLQWYKDMKTGFNGIFDAAKSIPKGLWNKTKEITGGKAVALQRMVKIQEKQVADIAKLSSELGKDPKDIANAFMKFYEMDMYKPTAKLGDLFNSDYINYNPLTPDNFAKFKDYIIKNITTDDLPKYSDDVLEGLFTKKALSNGVEVYVPKASDKDFIQSMLGDVNKFMAKQAKYNAELPKRIEKVTDKLVKERAKYDEAFKFVEENSKNFKQVDGKYVTVLDDETLETLNKLGLGLKKGQDGTVNFTTAIKRIDNRVSSIDKRLATLEKQVVETPKNVGYHMGDLGKSEYFPAMKEGNRGTGHFGTGTYFTGTDSLKADPMYKDRPQKVVNFEGYNLFKPKTELDGFKLHDGLKELNKIDGKESLKSWLKETSDIGYDDNLDIVVLKKTVEEIPEKILELKKVLGVSDVQFNKAIKKVKDYSKKVSYETWDDVDSMSTVFMKALGFEGIDVRGLKRLDNDEFGSVVYNLRKSDDITDLGKVKVNGKLLPIDDAKKALSSLKDKMKQAQTDIVKRNDEFIKGAKNTSINITKRQQELVDLANSVKKLDFENDIKPSRYYSDLDVQQKDAFLQDPTMSKAYQQWQNQQNYMYEDINFALGVDLKGKYGDGYIRHMRTTEAREFLDSLQGKDINILKDTGIVGNTATFRGRNYQMSAYEANMVSKALYENIISTAKLSDAVKENVLSLSKMNMFEEDALKATWDFINETPKVIANGRKVEEVINASFSTAGASMLDPDLIRPLDKTIPIPYDKSTHVVIDRQELVNKLNNLGIAFKNEQLMKEVADNLLEGDVAELVMDKNLYNLIGFNTNKSVNEFADSMVRIIDSTNNMFKKFKLLSPGFQIRNLVGNYTNIMLSGVDPRKIIDNGVLANRILKQGDELVEKAALRMPLTIGEQQMLEIYEGFTKSGFDQVLGKAVTPENMASVYDIPESVMRQMRMKDKEANLATKIMGWNARTNELVDRQFRMSAFIYAQRNPEILTKVGVTTPAEFVRKVLFDPRDLSKVEQQYLKRLIPFYTFTKKNLAYQMKNVFDNPNRYNKLIKGIDAAWVAADIDPKKDLEQYKRENMWIPVFVNENGEYKALKANLPVGDFGEFIANPLKKIVASTAPAVRTPFELAMNTQAFTGMPIQEFQGQRGYQLPFMGRKAEYLLSQTGLDVPLAMGSDVVQSGINVARGGDPLQGIEKAVGRSFLSSGSVEKARLSKDYERLNNLRDTMRYYKQEGRTILTLDEIEQMQRQSSQTILQRIRNLGR